MGCGVRHGRMMFPAYLSGDVGYHVGDDEIAHYGIGAQCGPMWNSRPAQAIDIDCGGAGARRGESSKHQQVKRELVIFPRRKAGQCKRQADNEAPVKLTPEILDKISNIPLVAAAKKLGISKTALKNACRNLVSPRPPACRPPAPRLFVSLRRVHQHAARTESGWRHTRVQGLKRWPFRRRREDARRNALMKGSSSTSSTQGQQSPEDNLHSNNSADDNTTRGSPTHGTLGRARAHAHAPSFAHVHAFSHAHAHGLAHVNAESTSTITHTQTILTIHTDTDTREEKVIDTLLSRWTCQRQGMRTTIWRRRETRTSKVSVRHLAGRHPGSGRKAKPVATTALKSTTRRTRNLSRSKKR